MSTHLLLINPLLANLTHYNESGWPVWLIIILQGQSVTWSFSGSFLVSIASLHMQNPLLKPLPLWLCRPHGQRTTFPGHAFIGCIGHCRLENTFWMLRRDMENSEVLTCNSTLIPTPSTTVTLRTPVPTYSLRGIRLVTLHYSMATTAVSVLYFNGDR